MKFISAILITFSLLTDCHTQPCSTILNHFSSYNEAINIVEHASFKISESLNTDKSSWIRGAHYYSCDGITGYLIINLKGKDYIHANLPLFVWNEFKKTSSFGTYYDQYIKHRYRLHLN